MGRIAHNLASRSDNPSGASLLLQDFKRFHDRFRRSIAHIPHWVQVPRQGLLRASLGPRQVHGYGIVDVHHFTTQLAHALENSTRIPANVETDSSTHRMDGVNQSFLPRPHKFIVDARPTRDAAASPIPMMSAPASICAEAKRNRDIQGELEEFMDKCRVIGKVDHQSADPTQVGSFGAGAFNPSLDEQFFPRVLPQQLDSPDAVFHAPPRDRAGDFQSRQSRLVLQTVPLLR